ncbi:hypothetical protein DUI87_13475 [Hirundo rustica rustica]|uniref:Peptidase A2 domain-containing protein n=1 Tax=Hirundo rustica rustica TaxID=333673 RepID=A0A3M0K951_HIRRU|nr:hypothetical protein DUI87_13475 [Hirundo rustica rustica]
MSPPGQAAALARTRLPGNQVPQGTGVPAPSNPEVPEQGTGAETAASSCSIPTLAPVTFRNARGGNNRAEYHPFPRATIKEICKAHRIYGRDGPYFRGLLRADLSAEEVVPADLKYLFSCLLNPTEYILWVTAWKRLLQEALPGLLNHVNTRVDAQGIPLTLDHLAGEGQWAEATDQVVIPVQCLHVVRETALTAFFSMQTQGPAISYSKIRQDQIYPYTPNQPYQTCFRYVRLQLTEGLHLKDDNWNFVSVDNSEQGTWPRVKGKIVAQIIPTWEHLEEDNIPTACPVHNITEVKPQVGWFELQEDKVQRMPPWRYLGLEIGKRTIVPQKLEIKAKIQTLADVHQLCGALNWLAVRAVERNTTLGPGDPRRMVNIDMLMGTGNHTRAEGQAGYEPLVQEQCQQTGMAALVQTLQLATPQQPFATIVQGVDEPFLCFAGRLTAAVEKQFGKRDAEREGETRADTNVSASAPTNGDLLSRLAASTRGSAGVDVCTAESVVIDSDKIHKVPLDAFGPLGDGMSAFLMGRSSATIQGIIVHLGLIDADFSGQIHAMVSTPTPPLTIPKGTQIAQLVPFKSSVSRTEDQSRGDGGFGSTGPPQVHWTAVLTKDRPETLCTVSMVGATPSEIHLRGLLDTGADVSILSLAARPPQWPLTLAKTSISGLGGTKQCYVSRNPVAITNPEGQTAIIWPHVTEIAQNLWGRDVLAAWGCNWGRIFDWGHCDEGHRVSHASFTVAGGQTHLGESVAPPSWQASRPS